MITYKSAGVDVKAGNKLIRQIKKWAPRIGGFSDGLALPKGVKDPVLVGCADGVGTKLAIAHKLDRHDTIGFDLVGMNVNDLICSGAKPLFFLDYFACGKLNVKQAARVVQGIAKACKEAQCELLGGETAEMPGFYKDGEYDLAGFATGVVSKRNILQPKKWIRPGDILLGLPSSGLHSNGYSLVRRVFSPREWRSRASTLLKPTKIYVRQILPLLDQFNRGARPGIKGLVHITGGGFTDNIPRILPPKTAAKILLGSWVVPQIFKDIQKRAKLPLETMFRTFNMGIGMILVVSPDAIPAARRRLPTATIIGEIVRGRRDVRYV